MQVGNRLFKNYESESYGYIDFAEGPAVLLRHLLLPGRAAASGSSYGSDPQNVDAKDPLVEGAKNFGFGKETGIDLPGEASGRIADRHWKLAYWKSMKGYYCKIDQQTPMGSATSCTSSPTSSASRAATTAPATP